MLLVKKYNDKNVLTEGVFKVISNFFKGFYQQRMNKSQLKTILKLKI